MLIYDSSNKSTHSPEACTQLLVKQQRRLQKQEVKAFCFGHFQNESETFPNAVDNLQNDGMELEFGPDRFIYFCYVVIALVDIFILQKMAKLISFLNVTM